MLVKVQNNNFVVLVPTFVEYACTEPSVAVHVKRRCFPS